MYSTLPENSRASLRSMTGIEARRFAKHPLFLVGALAAWSITLLLAISEDGYTNDLLSWPIVPAFFIGLTSLVVAARLVRSTEVAVEATGTAPGTEARRTLAVAGACLVPFAAGLVWLAEAMVIAQVKPPHPNELWFGNVNDAYVWGTMVALGPVACLGGALLGVLLGRWLRFRGAPAVAVVAVVALDMLAQMPIAYDIELSKFRLWVPWAMFGTGTVAEGEATGMGELPLEVGQHALLPGNPVFYLVYLLALCALAVGGAVWHDRTARTPRLRLALLGVVAFGCAALALAILTRDTVLISEVLPYKVKG